MAAIEEEGSEAFTLGQCLRSEDQKPLRPLHISLNFTAALQIKNYYSCFIVGETEVQKSDFPKVTQLVSDKAGIQFSLTPMPFHFLPSAHNIHSPFTTSPMKMLRSIEICYPEFREHCLVCICVSVYVCVCTRIRMCVGMHMCVCVVGERERRKVGGRK